MKTIKVNCDFGLTEVKTIGKAREILGQKWILVHYPCKYMNATEPLLMRKIVHYNTGGVLPIFNMPSKAPQKDFFTEAETFLNKIGEAEIKAVVNKQAILNN
jgi:hypothetical protein